MLIRRLTGVLAAAALVLGMLVASAIPASAAGGVWCDPATNKCYVTLDSPPSDPAPNPDSNGWTAGAAQCWARTTAENAKSYPEDSVATYLGSTQNWYVKINCGDGFRYWSNNRQCYVQMVDGAWPARPGGYDQDAGYYRCTPHVDMPSTVPTTFWSNTVPPGLQVFTPGMAARKLIETFQIRGVDIGMAPEVNPQWGHRRSYVGVPVWLWVENPQPLTWGPYTETATLGGQTITATAQVSSIRWDMGDGGARTCGGIGTPYSTGYGIQDSPTCGYRYTTTSEGRGGDRFTVTATTQWVVTWTSLAGPGGTINLTAQSAEALEVNELQTVNVTPNGTPVP